MKREAGPAGPDTPRAVEAPTVVPVRPGPADRGVDTTPSQAPPGAGGGEIAAVGAPEPTPLMPPPPPAAEVAAQQAGDTGPDSGVPLPRTLQLGVRRTMPRAASTTASGVAAASRAVATHGLGGGADPARVRSSRQLQIARESAKQLERAAKEVASRAPAMVQAAVRLAWGHCVIKCQCYFIQTC